MSIASLQFTIPMRKHRLHTSYTNFENTIAITMFFFFFFFWFFYMEMQ